MRWGAAQQIGVGRGKATAHPAGAVQHTARPKPMTHCLQPPLQLLLLLLLHIYTGVHTYQTTIKL